MDHLNVPAKFEGLSFTRSWDNSDWNYGWGCEPQSWGREGRIGGRDGTEVAVKTVGRSLHATRLLSEAVNLASLQQFTIYSIVFHYFVHWYRRYKHRTRRSEQALVYSWHYVYSELNWEERVGSSERRSDTLLNVEVMCSNWASGTSSAWAFHTASKCLSHCNSSSGVYTVTGSYGFKVQTHIEKWK